MGIDIVKGAILACASAHADDYKVYRSTDGDSPGQRASNGNINGTHGFSETSMSLTHATLASPHA